MTACSAHEPPADRLLGARFTLRQLEYFVAVAEAGTVTAAAERVHLSQSAMSTALADLERVLGVQLLVRHHARGVTLTASGDALLFSARELLRQADDLDASADALGHSLVGRLRLGCFAILAPYVLPALLAAVEEELPGLEVEPVEEPLDGIQTGLLEGRFELALTYDLALAEGIETRALRQIRPYALLASSHPLSTLTRCIWRTSQTNPSCCWTCPIVATISGRPSPMQACSRTSDTALAVPRQPGLSWLEGLAGACSTCGRPTTNRSRDVASLPGTSPTRCQR